ncbi:MAG: biopolymer transporter ExbD [Bacteroidota bacterium]
MPKFKKARIGIRIDMTPMVDVAFLLLTFFMLTTQFRPPEEVEIVLPSSHSPIKIPESDVSVITVSKTGALFMSVDQQNLRVRLFGEEARLKESVPVELPQLEKLLITARISNPKLRFVIKGDKDADYGPVMDVMNIFDKTKISRFNLVTDLQRD